MAITYVGGIAGSGNTLDISSIGAAYGDIVVLTVYRDNSSVAPSFASGWVGEITTGTATNWLGIYWNEYTPTSYPVGTWTNATHLAATVYRPAPNHKIAISRGAATGGTSGSGSPITYTNLSQISVTEDSWMIGVVGHRLSDVDIQNPPSGMVNRVWASGSAGKLAVHDTNVTTETWAATDYVLTSGTASAYRTIVFQIAEYEAYSQIIDSGVSRFHPLGGF